MPKTPAPRVNNRLTTARQIVTQLQTFADRSDQLEMERVTHGHELDVVPPGAGPKVDEKTNEPITENGKPVYMTYQEFFDYFEASRERVWNYAQTLNVADLVNSMIRQDQASADKMTDDLVKEFPEEEDAKPTTKQRGK